MRVVNARAIVAIGVIVALVAGGLVALFADGEKDGCTEPVDEGVELVYQPQPRLTDDKTLAATVEALCDRSHALDAEAAVSRRDGVIVIRLADDDPSAERQLTGSGEVRLYDWEPNVIGNPGPGGHIPDLYRAVRRAAKAQPRVEGTDHPSDRANDSAPARWYFFDRQHELVGGPELQAPPRPDRRAGIELVQVPRGIVVIEDRPPAVSGPATPKFYYVLEDDVELDGSHITDPQQATDRQTQEPIVTMGFTDEGRRRFANVTRRIAQRGSQIIRPPGADPEQTFQQFAITVDDQIVSLATIDYLENPAGIDGTTGVQINGIGSLEETQGLADILRLGPLPVQLQLMSRREL